MISKQKNKRAEELNNKMVVKFPSELRFDLASKNWVVIATGRAKRPEMFKKEKRVAERIPKKDCPFCKIETQETPVLAYANGKKLSIPKNWTPLEISSKNRKITQIPKKFFTPLKNQRFLTGRAGWTTIVVPNKYPAFIMPDHKLEEFTEGNLYQTVQAVGFHEVVITKDHDKHLALLPIEHVKEVIDVYQARYLELKTKPFVNHIAIFHNHGKTAGASIYHPHSQIITTPLIDEDLRNALATSRNYLKKHKKCVYCEMTEWEKKVRKRIFFENKDFLVLCPFASRMAFQVIISPKKHFSHFETITESQKKTLAEAFKVALYKIYKGLNNPDYNFYLHTAPVDSANYDFYHWHWTILPKTAIHAGFELGVQMEISTIEPEKAAAYLRKQ